MLLPLINLSVRGALSRSTHTRTEADGWPVCPSTPRIVCAAHQTAPMTEDHLEYFILEDLENAALWLNVLTLHKDFFELAGQQNKL